MHVGDRVMAIGRTTGVVEFDVEDLRINLQGVDTAPKGSRCSVAVKPCDQDPSFERLRRSDKIYIWEKI